MWGGELTHGEGGGADVGGEVLLERPARAELVAGSDLPEARRGVSADPPVDPVVLVLARVLVLIVHLLTRARQTAALEQTSPNPLPSSLALILTSPLRAGSIGSFSLTASG